MNAQFASTAIYAALVVLYFLGWQGIVYRLIFVDRRFRPCDAYPFHNLLEHLNGGQPWQQIVSARQRLKLGWLSEVLTKPDTAHAAVAIEHLALQANTHLSVLALVANLSTLFGLLGTVTGFLIADDVTQVGLSVALQTTFWGIVVGLPPAIYVGLTHQRRDHLDRQFEELLVAIRQHRRAMASLTPSEPSPTGTTECPSTASINAKPTKSKRLVSVENSEKVSQMPALHYQVSDEAVVNWINQETVV